MGGGKKTSLRKCTNIVGSLENLSEIYHQEFKKNF